MLARKINSAVKPFQPVRLRTRSGGLTSNPALIVSDFAEFLSFLYATPGPFPEDIVESFFRNLNLPAAACETLNASTTEVLQAIKSLKSSSAPGPVVFSGLCYKKFAPLLILYLTNYFNALKRFLSLHRHPQSSYNHAP